MRRKGVSKWMRIWGKERKGKECCKGMRREEGCQEMGEKWCEEMGEEMGC